MAKTYSPLPLEQSKYANSYREKIDFSFGNFYIFDDYVVGEVAEGIHFNWDKAKLIIEAVYNYFNDREIKVSYVSNRIHSYSVQPNDWIQFFKERHNIKAVAVVSHNEKGLMSVVLEKIFSKAPIRKFRELDKAVDWILTNKTEKVSL
ncbi:MAG: hypothetical protein HKN48_04510 [Flavobacteriaceae bacterium]|nr:hypothetical protein [Flavobacteriaceae bacterium]